MRGTDLPFNKRITLPDPVEEELEVEMHALKTQLKRETLEYMQQEGAKKTNSNLSSSQSKGLKSLIEKVNNKEVVIFETDKSGRFSVDTLENYRETGRIHIDGDPVITEENHTDIEKYMNAHAVTWIRMLNAGSLQRDQKRIK